MDLTATATLPKRQEVPVEHTWDLASLYPSDDAWRKAFGEWEKLTPGYEKFKGKLAESARTIADCLEFDIQFERLGERVGTYAFLKESEDAGDSEYQGMKQEYVAVASTAAQTASFLRPELLAIPDDVMQKYLADPVLEPHKITLERLLRYKPHTLSANEERLLAMQIEMAQAAHQAFHQLTNTDMKFGEIEIEPGKRIPLSHGSFSACLHKPDRNVRKQAFHQYYAEFTDHSNTLAATLTSSIHRDVYYAKARNYPSALESALFDDHCPPAVYDNLIAAVRSKLPDVHRYFQVRRRAMKLPDIHHYDTYVPIVADIEKRIEWDEAVETVLTSLQPLGGDYLGVLEKGLRGRWCDRYENKGKRSGAFSSGSFDGDPYILMNYQPDVLDHVFTLTHEAGHSMHSHYSAKCQPFQYYNYTIFVAEVASTFNEQLLSKHLMERAKSDRERAYYINREIDAMRGTIVRQTMFAEFEKIIHALAENREPLTLDRLRSEYRKLLEAYFGPEFTIDDELSMECLRIPHFYRAFYVFKYATGLSAAIALANRVLNGGKKELESYLKFLSGGCSKYPLDLLRDAGVDMETPTPVEEALSHFGRLVEELDRLV
jgi:oligoendopeptidase F